MNYVSQTEAAVQIPNSNGHTKSLRIRLVPRVGILAPGCAHEQWSQFEERSLDHESQDESGDRAAALEIVSLDRRVAAEPRLSVGERGPA